MSERFEQSIQEWYDQSRTANLEYLDLAETHKPKNSDIFHNLAVTYDRLSLLSKVSLKNFHLILENQRRFNQELVQVTEILVKNQKKLVRHLDSIQAELLESKPLTKKEVRELVVEISSQPKKIEEQALKASSDLLIQVQKVESLVSDLKTLISS